VLSGRGLCEGPITRRRSPVECGVSECDRGVLLSVVCLSVIEEPHRGGPDPGPLGGLSHEKKTLTATSQFIVTLFFIDTSYLLITSLLNFCHLH
jgi:hypothetical protein